MTPYVESWLIEARRGYLIVPVGRHGYRVTGGALDGAWNKKDLVQFVPMSNVVAVQRRPT